MALGNLDINTMQRIDDFNPDAPYTQVNLVIFNVYLLEIMVNFIEYF